LSFTLAYFLSKGVKFANLFRVIFFLPSILSTVVLAMAYRFMFNPEFGPVNKLFVNIFGSAPDWFSGLSPTAMPLVFFFTVWSGLGYKMLLLSGAVQRIPIEVLEAGKIDGVSLRREMFQIVLPLVMPTITTLFILNTLGIFGYFLHPFLLTGEAGGVNGSTGTVALRVVSMMQHGSGEDAAAIGLLFSLIGVPFIMFIKWFMEKLTPDVDF
jgi:ABC-type sugar transport system permease subunit